jgi:hypothetical protein
MRMSIGRLIMSIFLNCIYLVYIMTRPCEGIVPGKEWKGYDVKYTAPEGITDPHVAVFVHALVGVFQKKRGGGTWGHGLEILLELLDQVRTASNYVFFSHLQKSVISSYDTPLVVHI